MKQMTARQFRDKHAARVSASTPYVQAGVQAVAEAPGVKAAAKADKAKAAYVKAIESGKWAQRVKSVTLEDWKALTLAKIDRIPSGVEAAGDKIEKFAEQLLTFQATAVAEIERMPDMTPSQRDQRALAMMNKMRQFSFQR